jgi:hypothetical protein
MRYCRFNNIKIVFPSLITVMAQMVDYNDEDYEGCRKKFYNVGVHKILGVRRHVHREKIVSVIPLS